jgi:hypothetical protein
MGTLLNTGSSQTENIYLHNNPIDDEKATAAEHNDSKV